MSIKVDFTFDKETYRHYTNGHPSVLHCHHYMALTTKLAMDTADLGGTRILREVTEDSMRPLFDSYYSGEGVSEPGARLNVGADYYAVMGMGKLVVTGSADGGEAVLLRSHIDEGWIKKWGQTDQQVNHFTCGYLAALFAAAFDKPARSYTVTETASIVAGDPEGKLVIRPA